ncbi:hypothetical protein Pmani_024560 [Petrolisthes manimaculis]|uniref:Uncharacterized protein n=1 Tax=Petrolisthes manimaculis TaxID=1843537 RepID=A0AAE1U223_9EUCA|nr:hypothetical protein Pmani_024560 [Petrolisthes manimaculis]
MNVDEWWCVDGLCIPLIKRCDGHMNCYDQSDEQHRKDWAMRDRCHAGSVVVGTRVGTGVMNRTAIGLSSLSHRQRAEPQSIPVKPANGREPRRALMKVDIYWERVHTSNRGFILLTEGSYF